MLSLEDFADDAPWTEEQTALTPVSIPEQIAGVELRRLVPHGDRRGDLTVLMSAHYFAFEAPPHIYHVRAEPGSVRAWVYHKRQSDRLAYYEGQFRVVLYDLRPQSPTYGKLNILDVGAANPVLLTIPPFVIHGVQNRGAASATFVNMPTAAYDPARPDKSRVAWDAPGVPYRFE